MEDPLAVMIDGSSSVATIGERVTINCTSTTIVGVSQLPFLTLTHPNGTNLSSAEERFISIILEPVHITDAGEYTCTGAIDLENITSVSVQVKQNFTFKCECTQSINFLIKFSLCSCLVPTPMINVAYDDGSLEVGSSTVLNCTVENYSIADFDVLINVTWSRSGIVLSNDSDRVIISNLHESLSLSISQLTLSPLSANDDNITCSASVHLATPNSFIEMSPTVSRHVQLTIEGTTIPIIISLSHNAQTLYCCLIDPNIVVQIVSTTEGHSLMAGTNFSLICTVNGTAKLRAELIFEWMHFNGTDLEEAGTDSSKLHFSPLKLSNAGEYMCTVNISSSLLNSNLIINSTFPCPVQVFGKLVCMATICNSICLPYPFMYQI